jgi:hypothetical protein
VRHDERLAYIITKLNKSTIAQSNDALARGSARVRRDAELRLFAEFAPV